ncbi:hypothetical protein BJX99DRAFT_261553 [Aspergillus californicus]
MRFFGLSVVGLAINVVPSIDLLPLASVTGIHFNELAHHQFFSSTPVVCPRNTSSSDTALAESHRRWVVITANAEQDPDGCIDVESFLGTVWTCTAHDKNEKRTELIMELGEPSSRLPSAERQR